MEVRGKIQKINYGANLQMAYFVGQKLSGVMDGNTIHAIVRNLNYFNRTGVECFQVEVSDGKEIYVWLDIINLPCVPQYAKPTENSTNIYNGQ